MLLTYWLNFIARQVLCAKCQKIQFWHPGLWDHRYVNLNVHRGIELLAKWTYTSINTRTVQMHRENSQLCCNSNLSYYTPQISVGCQKHVDLIRGSFVTDSMKPVIIHLLVLTVTDFTPVIDSPMMNCQKNTTIFHCITLIYDYSKTLLTPYSGLC